MNVCCTEYIVTFTSYYTAEARDGYLSAALHSFNDWIIVPRSNPSQDYPSDFSLLRLLEGPPHSETILEALRRHPLIKRITPQRRLTRVLKFTEDGKTTFSPSYMSKVAFKRIPYPCMAMLLLKPRPYAILYVLNEYQKW